MKVLVKLQIVDLQIQGRKERRKEGKKERKLDFKH